MCPNVPHLFTFTYFQQQGMASILVRNIWRARYTSWPNCTRNTVFVCSWEYTNKQISEHICWGKNDNERTEKNIRIYSYPDLNMHKRLILFASYLSTKWIYLNLWIFHYADILIKFHFLQAHTCSFQSDLWFQRLPTTFQGSNAISVLEWKLTSLQWCRSEQLKQWVLEKTELQGDKCEPTKNESCIVEGRSKELQTKRISKSVPENYFA